MKTFIKKVSFFGTLIILISSVLLLLNYYLIDSNEFSIDSNKEILILGDSNSKRAVNDSIFNKAFNFSGSADSYYYSYLKLSKVIETNKQINTVFLSFSPHNIIDNGWLFNEDDMITRFPKYYPLMNFSDFSFLYKQRRPVLFASINRVFRNTPGTVLSKIGGSKITENYGGYEFVTGNNLKLVLSKFNKEEDIPHFNLPNVFKISLQEMFYLRKIVTLCKDKSLKLILMNPPKRKELLTHKRYFVAEFNNFYDCELNNIPFLDFSNFVLPDECYNDLVHLNYKGAKIFSTLLNENKLDFLLKNYKHR